MIGLGFHNASQDYTTLETNISCKANTVPRETFLQYRGYRQYKTGIKFVNQVWTYQSILPS